MSNPEFLKEGAAVEDFMRPDRIVIGADDERAIALLRAVYAPFQRNHERLLVMDVRSAELTKYAANAMLATRISFMNELANLADALGADIEQVRQGIGSDPRIGYHFLYPGVGLRRLVLSEGREGAAVHGARSTGGRCRILAAVEAANDAQKLAPGREDRRRASATTLRGRTFALWGLAFKPNTDDMREAPSRAHRRTAWPSGARRSLPTIRSRWTKRGASSASGASLRYAISPLDAVDGADALVDRHRVEGVPQPRFRAS